MTEFEKFRDEWLLSQDSRPGVKDGWSAALLRLSVKLKEEAEETPARLHGGGEWLLRAARMAEEMAK